MRNACLIAVLVSTASSVAAVDYYLPRNQTMVREENWETVNSISQDVRTPMSEVMPALGLGPDHGTLEFGWVMRSPYFEHAGPEDRERTRVNEGSIRLRGYVTNWWTGEITGTGMDAKDTGTDLQDVEFLNALSFWQERYAGAALVLGVGIPAGNGKELVDTHRSSFRTPTYTGELRLTQSYGFNVFHLNGGVRWNPTGEIKLEDPLTLDGGETIPSNTILGTKTVRGDIRAGWTYRPCKFARLGAEAEYTYRYATVENVEERWRDQEFRTAVFTEINPDRDVSLKGTFGADPSRWSNAERRAWVASAWLLVRF